MTWAQAFHDVGIAVAIAAVIIAFFWASTR
jgi:hypothetical protein